jgi:pimeloyl-ACP methyl ester carboxylesterase
MRLLTSFRMFLAGASALALTGSATAADDAQRLLTIDHYVRVKSTVPSLGGGFAESYVHERTRAGTVTRASGSDNVVLFVHGAGTPAEVAFDVPYQDYSWMAYLARAGYDVFSMDTSGYGRSVRPPAMNDPCNLSAEQQKQFVPSAIPATCSPSYPYNVTTIQSDWDDLAAVVDYVRALRHADKISLVAWSLGGVRAGGYAAQHPEKVAKLVFLAPGYNRMRSATAPALPASGIAMNTQSRADFDQNWDRQVGCQDQYDPQVSQSVWTNMLASDPVGATWGTGVRRAPNTTSWGFGPEMVGKMTIPTLMVSGEHDKQADPQRVRDLYADLGSQQKVFIDLACSSHNAMWERNHLLLFRASLEWLRDGTVAGKKTGMLRLGYKD